MVGIPLLPVLELLLDQKKPKRQNRRKAVTQSHGSKAKATTAGLPGFLIGKKCPG
jgi:hypothetical protein